MLYVTGKLLSINLTKSDFNMHNKTMIQNVYIFKAIFNFKYYIYATD